MRRPAARSARYRTAASGRSGRGLRAGAAASGPTARSRTSRGAAAAAARPRPRRDEPGPRCPTGCGTGGRAPRARGGAPRGCRSRR